MRVVFDTNVYVAALVFPGGRADAALQRAIDDGHRVLISKPVLDEILSVLARKFGRDREELARVALLVDDLCETVAPVEQVRDLSDEADNRVRECALAGQAELVVTGDRAMLRLATWRGIPIVTVAAFVDAESPTAG